jgi:hypothetical protein
MEESIVNETSMPHDMAESFGGLQYIPEAAPPPQSEIQAALAKAQGEFEPIKRDKTVSVTMKSGGKYTFSYAPLESILHAVMPALSANGLSLTQAIYANGKEYVETTLRHASGEVLSNRIPIFVRDDGPQAYGSALTYARRYGVTLLLCVSADDDDDGNAAEGNQAAVREPSANALKLAKRFKEAHATGIDGRIHEIHEEANKDQELYGEAWKLLNATMRREIKHAIDRVKNA